MIKSFVCDYNISSIYNIDIDFFVNKKIKVIFIDLDNTLVNYKDVEPLKRTYDFFDKLYKKGILAILVTNNPKKRVERFAKKLRVDYLSFTCKPLSFRLANYIKKKHIDVSTSMYIGDQLLNDIFMARRCKLTTILVEPLTNQDHISIRFFRKIEIYFRNKFRLENRLGISLDGKEQ